MEENSSPANLASKIEKSKKSAIFDFVKFIFIVALVVIPIRFWVVQPFLVSGASMQPTYEDGDYLIIDEFTYHFREPAKNEVIVFRYPKDTSKFFIKRIAGVPNETIDVYGNKVTLDEGKYFVMGDNRGESSDSRVWGPVPEKLIVGRALVRLWPVNHIALFPGY